MPALNLCRPPPRSLWDVSEMKAYPRWPTIEQSVSHNIAEKVVFLLRPTHDLHDSWQNPGQEPADSKLPIPRINNIDEARANARLYALETSS